MQSIRVRSIAASLTLALVACHDNGTAPLDPASIEIVAGNNQTSAVGQKVVTAPSFVVKDKNGHALSGVAITVAISAGNGSVSNAPKKSGGGATSVGTWTLGIKAGANQLTVTAAGLPPIVFTATASAGAASKIGAAIPTTFSARVGDVVTPAPVATVTDQFGNPVAGASVHVTVSGGGTASQTVTSDANGHIAILDWTLGPKIGQDVLTLAAGTGTLSFIANKGPSDPAKVLALSGDGQIAPAGTPISEPILVRVTDRFDNTILGQSATFSVAGGGGTVASTTASPDANGAIKVPSWTLGRTALPQVIHVTAGQAAGDVSAAVKTEYHIDVRFFGPEMTDAQKALFTNAAARLSALVTGDVPDVPVTNFDVGLICGLPGLPILNETINDLVIYASVQDIDGPGKILAQAGPCGFRSRAAGYLTTVGVMEFDSADLDRIGANGTLQDVITHEMLHVLGIGTLWFAQQLTLNEGTPTVTYVGLAGKQGCVDTGGATTCGGGVPVENNGVPGTADSHWRESVFQSELMTGYVNQGGMPLSAITAGSLRDMGYTVNMFAADPFTVPSSIPPSSNTIPGDLGWERPLPGPGATISPSGTAVLLKRP